VIDIGWDAIEPASGQYQFGLLDQWVNQAVTQGRKIDLAITAGASTPSWLFQPAPGGAGVAPLAFTVSPHNGATGACQPLTMAAPWDATFLARWDALLTAVAAHLKSTGNYDAVTILRLTGINRTTEEFRLPAETAQSTGLACVSNAIATWQSAGYRPSKLLQAWNAVTASFRKSFPDKFFGVAIIPQNAFPRIAEDGTVIVGAVPDQNQPLLLAASQQIPMRLIVQFDFLMPGEAASATVVQAATTLGTLAAFQTNEYLGSTGGGAACSEPVTNPTPCTAATFLTLLQTGIYPSGKSDPLRAQYIEVFAANAVAFPDDLVQAHNALFAGAGGVAPIVVEYYEPDLVDFFITADPIEQAFVDSGAVGRWLRTGNTFAAGGSNQVCRFTGNGNVNPATGSIYGPNSHFYTADANECAGLKAQFLADAKSWKFESNDFRTTPAVNGGCAAGLTPVYRAYNNGFSKGIDSNHRITSNLLAYQQAVALGWIGEGIVMCAPPPPASPSGIYVDSNPLPLPAAKSATLAASLTVNGVDGLVLVLGWDQVEPAMGRFEWSTLDEWMAKAIAAGIRVELSLRADLAPAWLFQPAPTGAGAMPLNFSYAPQGGGKPCSAETIAPPWDPAFLSQWDALLAAVAAHLKSAGTYNSITLLRLTGINRNSDELHLPAQTPQSSGSACVSDAVATWLNAGYRPSLLLHGWDVITDSFRTNFPDKYFSVAIIASTYPFPPIAEDGSVIPVTNAGTLSSAENLPLLTLASQKFPGRLVIQNNSLYPDEPAQAQTVQSAQSLGTRIAFQTNEDFGSTYGGAGCGSRGDAAPSACTASTFLAMLERGIYPLGPANGLQALYLEVFAANVNAFPAVTLQAHNELVP
jgi:hypothetical protein